MVVAESNSLLNRPLAKLVERGLEFPWGPMRERDSGLESVLDPES